MTTRIVKMSFKKDKIEEFLTIFKASKEKIENFPGCSNVTLFQSKQDTSVFFTYSIWDSEKSLNNYRNSSLFGEIWPRTKQLFDQKPEAWSLREIT